MKIQSPLSSETFKKVLLGVTLIVLVFVGATFIPQQHRTSALYHQSQWNAFAPEIERALENEQFQSDASQSQKPLNLAHVYGGVVSHHIPTTIPRLVQFYSRLKKTQTVENFIVIGPDHTNAGKAPISVSNASFFTVYGEVKPIDGLAEKLSAVQLAAIDESPFDPEHSVGSQILLISKIFPNAHVTPIILRSDTTKEQASALGKKLAELTDEQTVIIASVDFSHYLSTNQAMPIDQISGQVVQNLDLDALSLIKADSGRSMAVFIEAMTAKKATATDDVTVLNTNDLMQNSDYTTGYVFGYWGRR